jgi:hypothetical protein
MEGKNIDKLDDVELKKLNLLQQLGCDRVKNVINISATPAISNQTPHSPTKRAPRPSDSQPMDIEATGSLRSAPQ